MSGLERIEKYIIVFLTVMLLLGAGILVYLRSRPPARIRMERFSVERSGPAAASSRININEAGVEELMELKGIGKALAGRIVEYRSSKGRFLLKEDIERVEGIGPALYEKIKNEISVE
jgi:competence ComEA-like helix-hairpin-helix protein